MREQILTVLAGEKTATWKSLLIGTLKNARASAPVLGVKAKEVELAWRKHRERKEVSKHSGERAPVSQRWRYRAVRAAYARCGYRSATHSHTLLLHPGIPGAASLTAKARPSEVGLPNSYSKLGYWVTTSEHEISYSENWVARVKCRRADVVDGKLTLDLSSEPVPGTSAYPAVWIEQGRGTSLVTVRGWLAQCRDGTWRHVRSEKAARAVAACGALFENEHGALFEFLYEQDTYCPVVRLRSIETGAVVGIEKHGFEKCFKLVRRAA